MQSHMHVLSAELAIVGWLLNKEGATIARTTGHTAGLLQWM